jgi:hypothetical protein
MSIKLLLTGLVATTLASTALSQAKYDPSGILKAVNTNWVTRWSSTAGGTMGAKYKCEDVRFSDVMSGAAVTNYDFNTATKDTYRLHIHFETGATTNVLKTTSDYSSGVLPLISGVKTSIAFTPIQLHGAGGKQFSNQDVYIGCEMLSPIGTGNDGGWHYFVRGSTPTGTYDMPGARLDNTAVPLPDRLTWGRAGPAPAAFGSTANAWHIFMEPIHAVAGGIGGSSIAKTNQTTQLGRGGDHVIAGQCSGQHPDTNNHNAATPPRDDEWGFCVEGSGVGQGDVVVFLLSAGWFPVPGGIKVPNTIGRLHVNPNFILTHAALAVKAPTPGNGFGARVLLPGAIGKLFPGLNLYWQGAVVNVTRGLIGFSGAQIQKL